MQGFTQFIIWSKIIDILNNLSFYSILNSAEDISVSTSQVVHDNLTSLTNEFFHEYPPKYFFSWAIVHEGLANISTIPDDYWPLLGKYATTLDDNDYPPLNESYVFYTAFGGITFAMENTLLETFGIDLVKEVVEQDNTTLPIGIEFKVNTQTWGRFNLVVSLIFDPEHTGS